jgi:hypothetical protein
LSKDIKGPNLFQDSGIPGEYQVPNILKCLFWYVKQELSKLNSKTLLKVQKTSTY